jgi:hypothetical protein
MRQFSNGDRVRIDIPDENDPDFGRLHDKTGKIIGTFEDDAGLVTRDDRDNMIYRVELADDGSVVDVRWRDLRPL